MLLKSFNKAFENTFDDDSDINTMFCPGIIYTNLCIFDFSKSYLQEKKNRKEKETIMHILIIN